MIQWKLGCRSRKQKRKTQSIARPRIEHYHWFILPLLLATPTMQFSLDRKRRSHKQNQCSASDSVGLIFTRSYHFTLLITTPTTTPSLVKTSLKEASSRWTIFTIEQPGVVVRNFALSFSLNFLSICGHISGSIRLITLIWVSLERYFPPAEVKYRWCQFWSKAMTSEVEERPRLVTGDYGLHRTQWVNNLFLF